MSVSNRGATRATAFYVVFVTRAALAQSPPPSAAGFGQYGQGTEVTVPESPARAPSTPENMAATDPGWTLKEQRPVTRFGDAGQFVVIAGSRLGISSASYSASSASAFGVTFAPSLEYFIVKNVSVGAEIDLLHSSNRGYDATGLVRDDYTLLGAGLHLGLNVPLGERFSLYPMLSIGFHHLQQEQRTLDPVPSIANVNVLPRSADEKRTGPWLEGQVAVLYHPVEHFFVGAGPSVYHDFARIDGGAHGGSNYTSLGASFVLGGYFDPARSSEDAEAPAEPGRPPPVRKRFGARGTVLVTEESGFSYVSRSYSDGSSSSPSFSLAGGFDWFFTTSQSFGLAAYYSHNHTRSFAADASEVETVGISGRYGFLVPFYSWFSVYPRMALTYSITSRTVSSSFAPGYYSENPHVLAASIFVPALIHPASHFFVGVGPSVSEDIVHTTDRGPQNRRTAYGASTIIGGWL